MVKFIGGPSINAYKNYRNHTIARPGQFRMPRNYGRMSTRTTIIMNGGNTCHRNYGCGWGYGQSSLMGFMNLMPMIGSFFTNLFGLFAPKQPAITQNQNNNIFANSKPVTTTKTYTPTSSTATAVAGAQVEEDDNDGQNIEATGTLTFSTSTTSDTPEEELTVAVNVPKGKRNNGTTTYHGWKTLHASYKDKDGQTIPFSDTEFRNWFRSEYLTKDGNTAHIWKAGETQNFPKSFVYKGKTYTFDSNTFNTPLDTSTSNGNVRSANMAKRTNPGSPGTETTTYKGSITVAGKTYHSNGKTKADDVKNDLKRQIENAKNAGTITQEQYNAALTEITNLRATEEPASS